MLEGFDDMLVIAQEVEKYNLPGGPAAHQRMNDKIWRPQPYIPAVYDGFDQTANFGSITQLSVPVSVGIHHSTPVTYSAKDGRDKANIDRYFRDAALSLASKVNLRVFDVAANWATLVSKRTVAATGFDDLAEMGAIMVEQGVPNFDKKAFYSARDYLKMAGQIAKPQTSDSPLARSAYERAYVKSIGNFDLFENDQIKLVSAATATGVTITNTQPLYYTPVAATFDVDGNPTNVDNRTQLISIAVTSGTVKVGDALTIAGVNSVHHISKQDTGQPKTFRIVQIVSGGGGTGTVRISPPIISGTGGTRPELEYKNVTAAPANGANITFLNTVTAPANVFFHKRAIELIPGTYAVDPGDGWNVVARGTTPKLGLPITYTRQGNINDLSAKARLDIDYGVGAVQPEMIGLQLFSQT
ncbi:P22 phage major capsid protein family protein [Sphingobium jiangsuense]|nr:P22 phage major capsid protein family protein [Sphingobium jiangsuense]